MDVEEDPSPTETECQALAGFKSDIVRLSGAGGPSDWPIQAIWSAMTHLRASVDPLDLREAGELNKLLHRIKNSIQHIPDMPPRLHASIVRLYLPEILRILPKDYSSILASAVAPRLPNIEPSDPE